MASFLARSDLAECALVLSLCTLLPRLVGDDAGARHSRWIIPRLIALVLKYAPELDFRIRPHLQSTNDSWRVDETYVKVNWVWKYLDRAVDSNGNTLDFMRACQAGWALPQSAFSAKC